MIERYGKMYVDKNEDYLLGYIKVSKIDFDEQYTKKAYKKAHSDKDKLKKEFVREILKKFPFIIKCRNSKDSLSFEDLYDIFEESGEAWYNGHRATIIKGTSDKWKNIGYIVCSDGTNQAPINMRELKIIPKALYYIYGNVHSIIPLEQFDKSYLDDMKEVGENFMGFKEIVQYSGTENSKYDFISIDNINNIVETTIYKGVEWRDEL